MKPLSFDLQLLRDMNLSKLESVIKTIYLPVMVREMGATTGKVHEGRKVGGGVIGTMYEVMITFDHPMCEWPLATLVAFEAWTFGRKPESFAHILDAEMRAATEDLIRHRDFYI